MADTDTADLLRLADDGCPLAATAPDPPPPAICIVCGDEIEGHRASGLVCRRCDYLNGLSLLDSGD